MMQSIVALSPEMITTLFNLTRGWVRDEKNTNFTIHLLNRDGKLHATYVTEHASDVIGCVTCSLMNNPPQMNRAQTSFFPT